MDGYLHDRPAGGGLRPAAPAEEPQQTAQAAPAETPAAEETPAVEETEAPPAQKATVRLGGLKGPTSMGMVKLLSDGEQGLTQNNYEFVMGRFCG